MNIHRRGRLSLSKSVTNVPGKPRRIELDFIRGIAILMVMMDHFWKPQTHIYIVDAFSTQFVHWGARGVDLFFVLSGFLVGGLLIQEYRDTGRVNAARFLMRRVFKIWPAFYFLLLFHVIARRHPVRTFLFQNLFHLQNFLGTSISQTWTLAVEEHFYVFLVLSLAVLASQRVGPKGLLVFCSCVSIVATILRFITVYSGNLSGAVRWTQNRLDSLMFGVIIAVMYYLLPERYAVIAKRKWMLAGIASIGCFWMVWGPENKSIVNGVGLTIMYFTFGAFLVLINEHSGRLREWRLYRAVAWIGVYSYSLYLWHPVVRDIVEKATEKSFPRFLWWPIGLALQFVSATAIAVLAAKIIEWPFLRWREHIPSLRDSGRAGKASNS